MSADAGVNLTCILLGDVNDTYTSYLDSSGTVVKATFLASIIGRHKPRIYYLSFNTLQRTPNPTPDLRRVALGCLSPIFTNHPATVLIRLQHASLLPRALAFNRPLTGRVQYIH